MRTVRIISVIFLTANLAVVVLLWSANSGSMAFGPWAYGAAVAWGRLAGLLLQLGLLTQLVLVGRVTLLERAFGYDRLNRFHRLTGYSLPLLLVAHPLLLTLGYGVLGERPPADAFIALTTGFEHVLRAVVSVLILLFVIAASVPWVRRALRYEHWHVVHLATYVAVYLAFPHQTQSGGDFIRAVAVTYWNILTYGIVGIVVLYRFLRPFALWYRHRFVVQRVVQESPDAWSVYITGRDMERFRFEPGQFATLHVWSRGLWAGHPFSFSREYDGATVRFTIKALGDDTPLVARLRPGTPVIVDGPLGVFTPSRARTDRFLLIGGGIGITPLRAMAGELTSRHADVVVLFGAKTRQHTALWDEVAERVPDAHLFLSQDEPPLPASALKGQIDGDAIRRFVPDVALRDVYVCGPLPMMDALLGSLRRLGVPAAQIHAERFAF